MIRDFLKGLSRLLKQREVFDKQHIQSAAFLPKLIFFFQVTSRYLPFKGGTVCPPPRQELCQSKTLCPDKNFVLKSEIKALGGHTLSEGTWGGSFLVHSSFW